MPKTANIQCVACSTVFPRNASCCPVCFPNGPTEAVNTPTVLTQISNIDQILRDLSEKFHKILGNMSSRRLIDNQGYKMPQVMYDGLHKQFLTNQEIEKLCADGFEACVRALAAMGATDVSIHECNPTEEPS